MAANIVRLASANDVSAIFTVRTSYKDIQLSYDALYEFDLTEGILTDFIASSCVWVAEANAQVVGFVIADMEGGCVFAVFLLPEHEGRGMGRLLMAEAERHLFIRHHEIWLETDGHEAIRANGFFRKCGWWPAATLGNGDILYTKRRKQ